MSNQLNSTPGSLVTCLQNEVLLFSCFLGLCSCNSLIMWNLAIICWLVYVLFDKIPFQLIWENSTFLSLLRALFFFFFGSFLLETQHLNSFLVTFLMQNFRFCFGCLYLNVYSFTTELEEVIKNKNRGYDYHHLPVRNLFLTENSDRN